MLLVKQKHQLSLDFSIGVESLGDADWKPQISWLITDY